MPATPAGAETFVLTALPDPRPDRHSAEWLAVSVFVTPRLTPPGGARSARAAVLADFPVAADWAAAAFPLAIAFGGGESLPAERRGSLPDADAWRAAFGRDTPVRAFAAPPVPGATRRLVSVQTSTVARLVRAEYAAQTSGPPPLADLLRPERLAPLVLRHVAPASRARVLGRDPAHDPPPTAQQRALAELLATLERARGPGGAAPAPPPDFHDLVALLGHYPFALRRLGLVVDVRVPRPAGLRGATTLRALAPALSARGCTVTSPPVRVAVGPDGVPRVADDDGPAGRTRSGVVVLDAADGTRSPRFEGVTVRARAAAQLLDGYAKAMAAGAKTLAPDVAPPGALPALQSDGIVVAHTGAGALEFLAARRGTAAALEVGLAAAPDEAGRYRGVALSADDVTRGYRVDAWDGQTRRWYSLCRYDAEYQLGSLAPAPVVQPNEGVVAASSLAEQPGDGGVSVVDDELFRWDGWSLCVPRPGTPAPLPAPAPARPGGAAPPVAVRAQVPPGSLPRLRYGVGYRFRARAVDLAGNSLDPTDGAPEQDGASAEIVYGRVEPIGAPMLAFDDPPGRAESLTLLAVRTPVDADFAALGGAADAACWVLPPAVARETAERHGAFDAMPVDVAHRVMADRGGELWRAGASRAASPSKAGLQEGRRYSAGEPLRYLPDPWAAAAQLRVTVRVDGLPITLPPVTVPFVVAAPRPAAGGAAPAWPDDRAPFRVVVRPAKAGTPPAVALEPRAQVVVVTLPQASRATVTARSLPDPAMLAHSTLRAWATEGRDARAWDAAALAGEVDLLTPPRAFELVHAVPEPLREPDVAAWEPPTREPGASAARVGGQFSVDRGSTAAVDLFAEWDEYVDDGPGAAPPHTVHVRRHVTTVRVPSAPMVLVSGADGGQGGTAGDPPFGLQVGPGGGQPPLAAAPAGAAHRVTFGPVSHALPDTRARTVRYTAVGSARYADFFAPQPPLVLAAPTAALAATPGGGSPVLARVAVQAVEARRGEPGVAPGAPLPLVRVRATPAQITAAGGGVAPLGSVLDVVTFAPAEVALLPCTERPRAPRLLYAVPTVSSDPAPIRVPADEPVIRRRTGNALRLYLERPWHTSGAGERLAVVCAASPGDASAGDGSGGDGAPGGCSTWGADPLGGAVPGATALRTELPASAFPDRVGEPVAATFEPGGRAVHLALHRVEYDADSDRYFCDVRVAGLESVFMPFVRLALAAYQPHALPGLGLSPVVLADPQQVLPDRALHVRLDTLSGPDTPRDEQLVTLKVSVVGAKPAAGGDGGGWMTTEVRIDAGERFKSTALNVPYATVRRGDLNGQVVTVAARERQGVRRLDLRVEGGTLHAGANKVDPASVKASAREFADAWRTVYLDRVELAF